MTRMRRAGRVSREGRGWGVTASLMLATLVVSGLATADETQASPRSIEVFVAADTPPVDGSPSLPAGTSVQIYALDGLERLEAHLSEGLSADADAAQAEALRRFRSFDAETRRELAQSAAGLARAVHYRLDRYPAIVLDGQAVIYGVTALEVALDHYRAWRGRAGP